jgi:internalin A
MGPINGAPDFSLLKGLKGLSTVSIAAHGVAHAALAVLAEHTGLRAANFGSPLLTDACLEHLKGMTKLSGLTLRTARITDAGAAAIAKLLAVDNLHLQYTQVGDAGVEHLKRLPRLQYLFLEGCPVTDAALVALAENTTLQHLDVRGTGVTAAGVEAFKRAKNGCKLVWDEQPPDRVAAEWVLSIGGTVNVRPSGETALKRIKSGDALPKEFALKEVLLYGNQKVTDELLAKLKGCKLEYLTLNGTKVSDTGVSALKELGGLNRINVGKTKITQQGRDELAKKFPKCKIETD